MNLKNRFSLGCSTIIFAVAGFTLFNVLLEPGSWGFGSQPFLFIIVFAILGAAGIVRTITAIRQEEGDALGNDQWLVIFGSFLFTAGVCLFALGGLCSMMMSGGGMGQGDEFHGMVALGCAMIALAAALAYWRRNRRKP